MNTENKSKKCPKCGSFSTIPYVYGLLSEDAHKKRSEKGEYIWGGCVIYNDRPLDYCKDCKESFGGKYRKKGFSQSKSIFKEKINFLK